MQNSDHAAEEQPIEQQASTQQQDSAAQSQASEHDAIRQGLIYPPPPSFYDQQPETQPAPQPTVSPAAPAQSQGQPYQPQPPTYQWGGPATPQQPLAPPPGYPRFQQGQGIPPYPGMQPGQPPLIAGTPPQGQKPKRSGWFWALWIVFTLVILLSCGLCTWGFTAYYTTAASQLQGSSNGINVVNQYYDALQNQDDARAYSYLSLQGANAGTTQSQFIQAAQRADEQNGHILRYTSQNIQIISTGSLSNLQFAVSVDIVRQKKSYTAHLTLGLVNQHWKIFTYDQI
jgi:Cell division protein